MESGFLRHNIADVQPRNWRSIDEVLPGKMTGVIWTNRKVCSCLRNHATRFQHELADSAVVADIEGRHPFSHGNRVQRHGWMVVLAGELFSRFGDRPIAKRSPFGASGDNSDVFHKSKTNSFRRRAKSRA